MTNPLSQADGDKLRGFIEEIESANAKAQTVSDRKKEIFARVRDARFLPKTVRRIVRIRAEDPQQRVEDDERLTQYLDAISQSENRVDDQQSNASEKSTHAPVREGAEQTATARKESAEPQNPYARARSGTSKKGPPSRKPQTTGDTHFDDELSII